jgi:hypothetical protein
LTLFLVSLSGARLGWPPPGSEWLRCCVIFSVPRVSPTGASPSAPFHLTTYSLIMSRNVLAVCVRTWYACGHFYLSGFSYHFTHSYRLVLSISGFGQFLAEVCMWACIFKGLATRVGRGLLKHGACWDMIAGKLWCGPLWSGRC